MIVGSSSAKTRLLHSMKALAGSLYFSSTPKQRIIRKYILRSPKYCKSRLAHANGFKDDNELAKGNLEILVSLNLIKVLGLRGAKRHEKAYINW